MKNVQTSEDFASTMVCFCNSNRYILIANEQHNMDRLQASGTLAEINEDALSDSSPEPPPPPPLSLSQAKAAKAAHKAEHKAALKAWKETKRLDNLAIKRAKQREGRNCSIL